MVPPPFSTSVPRGAPAPFPAPFQWSEPMATKFAEFMSAKKIDARRLIASSRQLERLRPEDRAVRLAARRNRKSDSDDEKKGEAPARRSGRTITPRLLESATIGKPVSGPAKTRILRAVNRLLEQKKQEPVDLRALF